MPDYIPEEAATQLIDGMGGATPEQAAQAQATLSRYKAQQEDAGLPMFPARQKAEADNLTRYHSMFTTPDVVDGVTKAVPEMAPILGNAVDPKKMAMQLANQAFLSTKLGVPLEQVAQGDNYRTLMNRYSAQQLMEPTTDDAKFYRLASDVVKGEKDTLDASNAAWQAGTQDALNGKSFSSIGAWQEDASKKPGYDEQHAADYTRAFATTLKATAPYRDQIDDAVKNLAGAADATKAGQPISPYGGTFEKVADDILAAPKKKKDQGVIIQAIMAKAAAQGADVKGFLATIGDAWMKGVTGLGDSIMGGGVRATAGSGGGLSGEPVADSVEPADLKAQRAKTLDRLDVINKARQIAEGTYNPISAHSLVTRALAGTAEMTPMLATAAVPGGAAALIPMMADSAYKTLSAAQPHMDRDTAVGISTVAAPLMVLGFELQASAVAAKLPYVSALLSDKPVLTLGSAVTAMAAHGAADVAGGVIAMKASNAAPLAVQYVASQMSKDVPKVSAQQMGDWVGTGAENIEQALSLFPLVAIGAGTLVHTDVKNFRALAGNEAALVKAGVPAEYAPIVVDLANEGRYQEAQDTIRQYWKPENMTTPQAQAATATLLKQAQAQKEVAARAEARGATPRMEHLPDGSGFQLHFPEGGSAKFATLEDAQTAKWAHNQQLTDSIDADMRAHIDQTERGLAPGDSQQVTFTGLTKLAHNEMEPEKLKDRMASADVLEPFRQAQREAAAAGDTEGEKAVATVLGSSTLEVKDGMAHTLIELHSGATPYTMLEEHAEAVPKKLIATGQRDWLVSGLRDVEARMQEVDPCAKLFPHADHATDQQVIEAYSHVEKSYFSNQADAGLGVKPDELRRSQANLREAVKESKLAPVMNGTAAQLDSVFQRADLINKLKADGKFNGDITQLIHQSLGMEQGVHDDKVVKQAGDMAKPVVGESHSLAHGTLDERLTKQFDPFMRDPELKRKLGIEMLNRAKEEGKKWQPLITANRKLKDIATEQSKRADAGYADRIADMVKQGTKVTDADRAAIKTMADQEAAQWAKGAKAAVPASHEGVTAAIRTYDAILGGLPPEIRGKIGGFAALSELKTDEARLKFIEDRGPKIEKVVEDYLRKEIGGQIDTLVDRIASKKNDAGVRTSKFTPESQRYFDAVREATEFTDTIKYPEGATQEQRANIRQDAVAERGQRIADAFDAATDPAEQQRLGEELGIHNTFANLKDKSAAELDVAADKLRDLISGAAVEREVVNQERRDRLDALRGDAKEGMGVSRDHVASTVDNQARKAEARGIGERINAGLDLYASLFVHNTHSLLSKVFGADNNVTKLFGDKLQRDANHTRNGIEEKFRQGWHDLTSQLFPGGDLQRMAKLKDLYNTEKSTGVMVKDEAGKEHEVALSQSEALDALMSWGQEDGLAKMEKQGWSEQSMEQVRAFMRPEMEPIHQWLREQYNAEHALLNPVHERLFNISLPFNPDYAPLSFVSGEVAPEGAALDAFAPNSGPSAGFLRERVPHNAVLRLDGAIQKAFAHNAQMAHWVAYSELVRDMKAVLLHPDVAGATRTTQGDTIAGAVKSKIQEIEERGQRASATMNMAARFLNPIVKAQVFAKLAYSISTPLKHTTNVLKVITDEGIPTSALASGFFKLLTGQLNDSFKAVAGSETIQGRISGKLYPELRLAMRGDDLGASRPVAAMEKAMLAIPYSDAYSHAMGAAIAHDYYLNDALKGSMSPEDAQALAMDKVDQLVYHTGMPEDSANRTSLQNSRNPFSSLLWLFHGPETINARMELQALGRVMDSGLTGTERARALRTAVVTHMLMPLMTQTLMGAYRYIFTTDNAEQAWNWKGYAHAMALGPASGLFAAGELADSAMWLMLGKGIMEHPELGSMAEAVKEVSDAYKDHGRNPMKDGRLLGEVGTTLGSPVLGAGSAMGEVAVRVLSLLINAEQSIVHFGNKPGTPHKEK